MEGSSVTARSRVTLEASFKLWNTNQARSFYSRLGRRLPQGEG